MPRPNALKRLRSAMRRFVHQSSEVGLSCWFSTLSDFVVVLGIDDDRQNQPLRVGAGEAGVAVAAPLHRRAHAVAVAEEDVVAHADLVAVVEHRRAGQREEQRRS